MRERTNGAGVNVILDLVGAAYLTANLDALAPRGRMVFVGTLAGASAPLDFRAVMSKRLHLMGTVLRARSTEEKARAVRLFVAHVVPLFVRGALRAVVDSEFPFTEARAAYERMESNASFGKIVLKVTSNE